MATNSLPRDVATCVVCECQLSFGTPNEGVWEVRLINPLVLLTCDSESPIFLPAGAVLFLPMGQMAGWFGIAQALASETTMVNARAYHNQPAILDDDQPLIGEPPF